MVRNGWEITQRPPGSSYSTVVPYGLCTVFKKGDQGFGYGIMTDPKSGALVIGPYSPIPKCCLDARPIPDWMKRPASLASSFWNFVSGKTYKERRRARERAKHNAALHEWLHMDLNAEILKVRAKLAQQ